jgi:galactokinase
VRRVVAFGPGRVNLIGEHTDYNGGLSLPFAIEGGVEVTAEVLAGDLVEAHAVDLGESDRFALADPPREGGGWCAFVHGVVGELRAVGLPVRAARLSIAGHGLPRGSGLSSSAALEVALCLALLGLSGADEGVDRLELARLCSRVENEWVGAQTGLLDQVASLFGAKDEALRVDFRTLDVQRVPLRLAGWKLVTVDSGEQHTLSSAAGYNERRGECTEAAEQLGVSLLSDAGRDDTARLSDVLRRRTLHVLDENERVEAAVAALRAGDLAALGGLLDASHASLRDQYDASTGAVERTVDRLKDAGAAGARMMGGGFGGVVLALFEPGTPLPAGAREVAPGAGARVLERG